MAKLSPYGSEHAVPLAASTLVGSSPLALIRLDGEGVSEVHALIRWEGHAWTVKDLGSRNGTFVDGSRLEPGVSTPIYEPEELSFGGAECRWTLVEDEPPGVLAQNLRTGELVCAREGMLALPDTEEPTAVALSQRSGAWSLEQGGAVRELREESEVIVVGAEPWRIYPALAQPTTTFGEGGWRLEYVTLVIAGEADSPNVRCCFVDNGGIRRELPHRPTPYRLLSLLGRAMLEDEGRGAPDRGWRHRDFVLSELDANSGTLDTWVFWCRKGASGIGITDGALLIERTHQGFLRLGLTDIVFDE